MYEKYLASVKKSLFSPEKIADVFFLLIKHFAIDELKKIPEFTQLKNTVIQLNIAPEEIYNKVGLYAVQRNKFSTIEFLIDECGYNLTNLHNKENVTPLHEACLWGSKQLVEYLLQKGFLPNAQNSRGQTPLHWAIQRTDKNKDFISLLKQHGANLDIQISGGLTALHISIIHNNLAATSELIALQANPNLTWMGLTYGGLKNAIDCGKFQAKAPTIALISSPAEHIEKTLAVYYKACLWPILDKSTFQSVIKELSTKDKLDRYELTIFIESVMLISSFSSQLLQKNLSPLIKNNKATYSDAVHCILQTSRFFTVEKQVDLIEAFNSLALAFFDAKKISPEEQCTFYHIIGFRYKSIGLLKKAEYYLQLALGKTSFKGKDSNKHKAEISFNLACTQLALMQEEKALENFKTAFNLDKNDRVSFERYIALLISCKKYDEALSVCQNANFGRFSEIFAAFANMLCGNLTWENLLVIASEDDADESTQILLLNLRLECYLKNGNYNKAIETAEKSFLLIEKQFKKDNNQDITRAIFRVLHTLIQAGNCQLGLERLTLWKDHYSFELNGSVSYHCAAAVLYIANHQFEQAEYSIQKMNNLGINTETLALIYCSLAMEILLINPQDNCERALNYINLAIKYNPNNLENQLYKLLLLILTENKVAAEEMLQTIAPEELLDISLAKDLLKTPKVPPENNITADASTIELTVQSNKINQEEQASVAEPPEENLAFDSYDQVKIHQFLQAEKKRLSHQTTKAVSATPQSKAKWTIKSKFYEEGKDGLTCIKHHSYSPCYAVIDPSLNLDSELRRAFQNALSNKGTADRKNNDGVQTLNNSVIQLAIRAEDRLYATKVYRNQNGEYLIVFTKHSTHPEVKRLARKKIPLKVIPLIQAKEQSSQRIINIIPADSIFAPPPPSNIPPSNKQKSNTTNKLII